MDFHYTRYEREARDRGCLTVSQAARRLGVTTETVVNWCDAGKIACLRSVPDRWRMVPRGEMPRAFALARGRSGRRGRSWDVRAGSKPHAPLIVREP